MKKKNWIRLILVLSLMSSIPLQAQTADLNIVQAASEVLYVDTSSMTLPFTNLPGAFISPLQTPGEFLAAFGEIRQGYVHQGVDIRAAEGTPIFAIADGVVTKAAPDSKGVNAGGGHMIIVSFENGVEGRYMHLSSYGVKAGDKVRAGQVIGFTGNTGESTTPHLHFEYRVNGVLMDPTFIFEMSGMIQGRETVTSLSGITTGYTSSLVNTYQEPFFVVQQ